MPLDLALTLGDLGERGDAALGEIAYPLSCLGDGGKQGLLPFCRHARLRRGGVDYTLHGRESWSRPRQRDSGRLTGVTSVARVCRRCGGIWLLLLPNQPNLNSLTSDRDALYIGFDKVATAVRRFGQIPGVRRQVLASCPDHEILDLGGGYADDVAGTILPLL